MLEREEVGSSRVVGRRIVDGVEGLRGRMELEKHRNKIT